jgi:EAL domain-containing protein (putative c-di-GMP-specific phosphodiesterase class I)
MNAQQVFSNSGLTTSFPRRFGSGNPVAVWILASLGEQPTEDLTVIHPFPFSIGRKVGCSLQIPSKTISGHHADLILKESELFVIDRESTNGTYVNGRRTTDPTPVKDGDMLQFADFAFRLKQDAQGDIAINTHCEDVCDQALALVQFDRLMEQRLVTPHYQPIVQISDLKPVGFEVLARSTVYGLETPKALFGAAAKLNMEVELSQMLRWEGVREGLKLPKAFNIYLNTHPLEMTRPGLIESMHQLREFAPDSAITLEIHESSITNCRDMNQLRSVLDELKVQLAYDDFGAGQNRLPELCSVPPDVLKFDMSLIKGLTRESLDRVQFLSNLVRICRDIGIIPLAEGIETQVEAEVCAEIGFVLGQGYYYGRPAPVSSYNALHGVL